MLWPSVLWFMMNKKDIFCQYKIETRTCDTSVPQLYKLKILLQSETVLIGSQFIHYKNTARHRTLLYTKLTYRRAKKLKRLSYIVERRCNAVRCTDCMKSVFVIYIDVHYVHMQHSNTYNYTRCRRSWPCRSPLLSRACRCTGRKLRIHARGTYDRGAPFDVEPPNKRSRDERTYT